MKLTAAVLTALFTFASLSSRASATDGYVLDMPPLASIGQAYTTCMEAPGDSFVYLFVGATPGVVPTKFGTLNVGLPFFKIFTFYMPPSGHLCFPHSVDCFPEMVGFTAYFQFVAIGPDPGMSGISNPASMTGTDTGACISPGSFATFTQGGWGQKCNGSNVACLRDQYFMGVLPAGLLLGDQDGIDGDGHFALLLTSSLAVQDFLPEGSTPQAFTVDAVNVKNSTAGVFAGQLAAAKLNVAFDDAGALNSMKTQHVLELGDLVFSGGVHAKLLGMSVRDVIALADRVISGELVELVDVDEDGEGDVSISDLSTALDVANNNFVDGQTNEGHLALPASAQA